jgi:hypothetical protein
LVAFLEIRDAWDAFLTETGVRNLTMTHGWLTAWLRRFPPGELCVIIVRDGDGHWLGAAPLQIAHGRTGYGQRLLRYVQFIGTHPTVFDWMDIAIHPQTDAPAVLAAMAGALRRRRWDALDLYFCPNRARLETLYHLLGTRPTEKGLNTALWETMPMPWLSLPDTEPEYLASRPKRTRANITRCRNLLLKETGHAATLVFHAMNPDSDNGPAGWNDGSATGADRLSGTRALLRRFVEGHIESWGKRGVKSDFKRYPALESFYADMLAQAADATDEHAPALLFSTLEKDGQPMSFHLGFRQGDGYLLHLTHFDRAFERYSPGALHIDAAIGDIIRRGGRLFNFGRGDEPYKRAWTKTTQPLWNLRLFRTPWHRALWELDATLKRLSGRVVL